MLKEDLILQIYNQKDHYLKEKTRVIALMTDELKGKIMAELVLLKPERYSCLADDSYDNKK